MTDLPVSSLINRHIPDSTSIKTLKITCRRNKKPFKLFLFGLFGDTNLQDDLQQRTAPSSKDFAVGTTFVATTALKKLTS